MTRPGVAAVGAFGMRTLGAGLVTLILLGLAANGSACAQDAAPRKADLRSDIDKALAAARARLATVREQAATLRRLAEGERLTLIQKLAEERKQLRATERATRRADRHVADLAKKDRTQRVETEARERRDRGIRATLRRGLATLLRAERQSLVTLEQPALRNHIQRQLAAVEGASGPLATDELAAALADLRTYLHQSRRIARHQAEAADAHGRLVRVEVCRLGQAAAYYHHAGDYGHLQLTPGGHWKMLPASEPAAIATLFAGSDAARVAPIDLSGGLALTQQAEHGSVWAHLRAGGPVMIPLGLLVLAAIYLVLERLWFLAGARRNTRRLAGLIPELASSAPAAAVRERLRAAPGPMARAIQSALDHPAGGDAAVDQALREATPQLERGLGLLGVLGTVAPFLGLLGTVTGLITTFATLTAVGTNDPRLLAGGISEALVTTQVGLILAIPILLVHAYLTGRVDDLTDRLEGAAEAAAATPRSADRREEEAQP